MAHTLEQLARAESDLTHFELALRYELEALQILRTTSGIAPLNVANEMSSIAGTYWELNQLDKAEFYDKAALAISTRLERRHGQESMNTLNDLALTYDREGKFLEEKRILTEILAVEQKSLRPDHPQLSYTWVNLAWNSYALGQFQTAEDQMRTALNIRLQAYKPDHWLVASTRMFLSQFLMARDKTSEALTQAREAKQVDLKLYGLAHKETAQAQDALGMALLASGNVAGALAELESALHSNLLLYKPSHPAVTMSRLDLAEADYAFGNLGKAREQIELVFSETRSNPTGSNPLVTLRARLALARISAAQHDFSAAENAARQALAISQQLLPSGHPFIGNAQAALGWTYLLEGRPADAEAPLKKALEIAAKSTEPTRQKPRRQVVKYPPFLTR